MVPTIRLFTSDCEFILISIPIGIIIAFIPLLIRFFAISSLKKVLDNKAPRLFLASLESEALMDNKQAKFALRCHACHLNMIEDCIIWWPAAIGSLLFSYTNKMSLALTAIHMILRFLYVFVYCFNGNKGLSYLRSFIWFCGWVCPMIMLFEQAHNVGPNRWDV